MLQFLFQRGGKVNRIFPGKQKIRLNGAKREATNDIAWSLQNQAHMRSTSSATNTVLYCFVLFHVGWTESEVNVPGTERDQQQETGYHRKKHFSDRKACFQVAAQQDVLQDPRQLSEAGVDVTKPI